MNTLLVFAKEPVPGRVKTRLAAGIGTAAACTLYRAFLGDLAGHLRGLSGTAIIWWVDGAPEPLIAAAGDRWHPAWRVEPQAPGSLGDRLEAAFRHAFATSPGAVGVIGSDCPHCGTEQLRSLFAPLSHGGDAVLLPAEDGGYAGLALAAPVPGLFRGIPWSTAEVAATTLKRLRAGAREVDILPPVFDVDTAVELDRLRRLLASHPERAPATAALLADRPRHREIPP